MHNYSKFHATLLKIQIPSALVKQEKAPGAYFMLTPNQCHCCTQRLRRSK